MVRLQARILSTLMLPLALVSAPGAWAGPPTEQLREGVDRVFKVLRDPKLRGDTQTSQRRIAISKVAIEIFDFDDMAKRALGQHGVQRTPAERGEFVRLFTDLIRRAYVAKVDQHAAVTTMTFQGETVDVDYALIGPKSNRPVAGALVGSTPMGQTARRESALEGVRVLLVDDHPAVRQVLTRVLEDWGAEVTAVPGVPEALEALGRERPNVVLSDIEMPGEDGYALIRKVRALPPDRGGHTPAAALTGLTTEDDRARVLEAGFQYHMTKPVDARRLVEIVTTLAASA